MLPRIPPLRHQVRRLWAEYRDLVTPIRHDKQIAVYRADTITARTQAVALVLSCLTAAWIPVDIYVFPAAVWIDLAALRGAALLVFLTIAMRPPRPPVSGGAGRLPLYALVAAPSLFHVMAGLLLKGLPADGLAGFATAAYDLLPVAVIAGLCLFPLTVVEIGILALPPLALVVAGPDLSAAAVEDRAALVWLALLLAGIAAASGGSQLRHILTLMHRANRDPVTGASSRRAGEDALRAHFANAARQSKGLAVAFIDIDDLRSLNDTYGHDVGDQVLRMAAEAIRGMVRPTDMLFRWGGEEFLLLLPGVDRDGARAVVQRLMLTGLGTRPDGRPLTASIGLANLQSDPTVSWNALVELANTRMCLAKRTGKNRCVIA